jgi:hypothetical protein
MEPAEKCVICFDLPRVWGFVSPAFSLSPARRNVVVSVWDFLIVVLIDFINQVKELFIQLLLCFEHTYAVCTFYNSFIFKDNSQNAPLVGSTLETLLRFLNWIPLGYIFETKLINTLIFKVCC